jgi:hypothetical protein
MPSRERESFSPPPPIPPVPPPKRKISDAQDSEPSSRQRSNPEMLEEDNNPWKEALQPGNTVRRKHLSPSLITRDLPVSRSQLPTPPPMSPGTGPSGLKGNGKQPEYAEVESIETTRRRYREVLLAEDTAKSESEKLRVFLDFVEKECRLRIMFYPAADPQDLQRLEAVAAAAKAGKNPPMLTPVSPEDVDMVNAEKTPRAESTWWGFPESSVSAYEARIAEEESSRGRTSSRWWESAGSGTCSSEKIVRSDGNDDDSVYGSAYPRRSKRYSKTKRQSLREIAEFVTTPRNSTNPNDPSSFMGSAMFPPDRKQSSVSVSRSRSRAPQRRRKTPVTTSLDIAPLLTLLPLWPKEYPSINNSHPTLSVFRNLVRTLNDLTPLTSLQSRFTAKLQSQQTAFTADSQRRRISQAERIQTLYSHGDVNFDEMERLNLDFESSESQIHHEAKEEEFHLYDREIVTPCHRDLHERISAATAAYADIVSLIRGPPKEGECEPPELLEYLTALKWVFDVREMLHREVYALLTQRGERYKALLLESSDRRHSQTVSFFTADAQRRQEEFLTARLARYRQFADFIEGEVTRGVEESRSRFWEIAPLVMESCEKIPLEELRNVTPIVPPEEYIDHPEWVEMPMRYLERKLTEAEGAMKGLGVEEGEGLLCLLHGVKSAVVRVRGEIEAVDMEAEERKLTGDLKEKVGMVEEEWRVGLGSTLEKVCANVKRELERREAEAQARNGNAA